MKISLNWLKTHIDTDLSAEEISRLLTGCGLEVESTEEFSTIPGALKGLVTGEVLTCERHPNADRLNLTTVDTGTGAPLQIVCGAQNVAAGQKVVVAPVGATVYPVNGEPFQISKSKIRGEVSEGMICAEDEIGLGTSHEGILVLAPDAPVGQKAADYFKIDFDVLLEIGLTANRGDAASHRGVARDLAALLRKQLKQVISPVSTAATADGWEVSVEDAQGCPRYSGLVISGITVKESPEWLKSRLRSLGLNPINNIVDVTNFVLHDLGQPIHAFDADRIKGKKIIVKRAAAGETFVTLDGTERKLNGQELMICNAEEAMAIAGVFGGLHSGVTAATTTIFIESAYFNATSVRKTARSHGLSTDASFRYERGTDPWITVDALHRVAALVLETAGGTVSSSVIDVYPVPVEPFRMELETDYVSRLLGITIPQPEIEQILQGLEIHLAQTAPGKLALEVPPFKSDVTRPVDVVEELIRIHGLDKITFPEKVQTSYVSTPAPDRYKLQSRVAAFLTGRGFLETATNSLTSPSLYPEEMVSRAVKLKNPLSGDLEILRMSLLPGMLDAVLYNRNRKNGNLRFFEFGKVYEKAGEHYKETYRLTLLITGNIQEESWHQKSRPADFYDLKQTVHQLLEVLGVGKLTEKITYGTLAIAPRKDLVMMGEAAPEVLKQFDLKQPVYIAELQWEKIIAETAAVQFVSRPVPKFPEVRRDLSLVLDEQVTFAELQKTIRNTSQDLIRNVNVFDVYKGDRLETGKKAYAISFTLQHDEKTLSDAEIDALMQQLIANFENKNGAVIRK